MALLRRGGSFLGIPLLSGVFKLNVDGTLRDKSGPVGIEGCFAIVWEKFCLWYVGVCDSNEVDVTAILEALMLISSRYGGVLVVESGSSNALSF